MFDPTASSLVPGQHLVLDPEAWQLLSASRTLITDKQSLTSVYSPYPVHIALPPRAELDAEFLWIKPDVKLTNSPIGAMFMVEGIVYRVVHAEVEILGHDLYPHLHIHAKSIWFDPDHFSTAPSDNSQPKTLQALPEKLLASSSINA